MLTRLEVNGFKNLVDFTLDFGPFTCLFGPNGAGKSNIIDAIRFLSLLTQRTINDAALGVRGAGDGYGKISALFHADGGESRDRMSFAVEMLVDPEVSDDFGREAVSSSTFLRYEVAFRLERGGHDAERPGGLTLEHEELRPITEGRASHHLRFPHSKAKFRDAVVYNRRHARTGYVSTIEDAESGQPLVVVHQDGGVPGWSRPAPAQNAVRTIVGTENTVATPTILATRREMQGWLALQLDPAAIRRPDRFTQAPEIGEGGDHIPATLQQFAGSGESGFTEILAAVSEKLKSLAPVRDLRLVRDDERQLLSLEVEDMAGLTMGAGSLSDSTLRSLALAALASVPGRGRLVCVDDPDHGIYPTNLGALNALLHGMAVDPDEAVSGDNPLGQVIMTSNSPMLILQQDVADLVRVENTGSIDGECGPGVSAVRWEPHISTWRCTEDHVGFDLEPMAGFGTQPQGGQIAFPSEIWETA
ncbi:MAG: AAA family ATPase [Chloroflexi bacterium]|nr:AAA family ATPase [Chloroflexota bacterium]